MMPYQKKFLEMMEKHKPKQLISFKAKQATHEEMMLKLTPAWHADDFDHMTRIGYKLNLITFTYYKP